MELIIFLTSFTSISFLKITIRFTQKRETPKAMCPINQNFFYSMKNISESFNHHFYILAIKITVI